MAELGATREFWDTLPVRRSLTAKNVFKASVFGHSCTRCSEYAKFARVSPDWSVSPWASSLANSVYVLTPSGLSLRHPVLTLSAPSGLMLSAPSSLSLCPPRPPVCPYALRPDSFKRETAARVRPLRARPRY